ncbi:hypothetical protein L1887_50224 [Cichorium endivia]|nr:hypothetical protein L1887_50224 [Cichorium endivia]
MKGGIIEAQGAQLTSCFSAGAPKVGQSAPKGWARNRPAHMSRGAPPDISAIVRSACHSGQISTRHGCRTHAWEAAGALQRASRRANFILLDPVSHRDGCSSGVEAWLPRCEILRPKNREREMWKKRSG